MARIPLPAYTRFHVQSSRNAGLEQRAVLSLYAPDGARADLGVLYPPNTTTYPFSFEFPTILEVTGQYLNGAWINSDEHVRDVDNDSVVVRYNDAGDDADFDDLIITVIKSRDSASAIGEFVRRGMSSQVGPADFVGDPIERLANIAGHISHLENFMTHHDVGVLDYSDLPVIRDQLNPIEKRLFDEDAIVGVKVLYYAKTARDRAEDLYVREALHNGNGDAFRHAYWNAQMKVGVGESWADRWGTAHEKGSTGQPLIEETMDLHNNSVGRSLGNDGEQTVLGAVRQASCKIISSGRLVPSSSSGEKSAAIG